MARTVPLRVALTTKPVSIMDTAKFSFIPGKTAFLRNAVHESNGFVLEGKIDCVTVYTGPVSTRASDVIKLGVVNVYVM